MKTGNNISLTRKKIFGYHISLLALVRIQVTMSSKLFNTRPLNTIWRWIIFISCLLTFLWTISLKCFKAETKLLSEYVSQLPLVTSAHKSALSVRKRMKEGRVGECLEMCESRGSPPPLSLPPSLSFSRRAPPLHLTSSNGPVSSPAYPFLLLWTIAWNPPAALRGVREQLF